MKYLCNFWQSRKMPLIHCKAKLKLKWTKHCVSAGAETLMTTMLFFASKDTKFYVPVVKLSAKDSQKLSELLSKGLERSVYFNEYKTKSEQKNMESHYRYSLE